MTAFALAAAPDLHGLDPIGDPYVLGRWHKDRANWRGPVFEARILAKRMLRGGRPGSHGRFLVIGRARSGTTLLTRLLNAVQGVHCDGEVLHHAVLDPRGHLNRLARVSDAPIYGCKLLSYQMHEVLRLRDPHGFLARAKADGFQLIHMRRHTLDQCLSLSVAQTTKAYVSNRAAQAEAPRRLNPEDFVAQVRWNEALLAYETAALAGLNPLVVDYERDLRDAAMHAATVGRICGLFDLAPHKIAPAAIRKQLGGGLDQVIDNADEIRAALRAAGLGAVLDAQDQAGSSNTQT